MSHDRLLLPISDDIARYMLSNRNFFEELYLKTPGVCGLDAVAIDEHTLNPPANVSHSGLYQLPLRPVPTLIVSVTTP